ncbi:hypothetical protein V8G54_029832 [Vigna mungo]|uniref:Uncharacterized protein n=1 Tax=Vigna mungo TaxID=3915 RepID=A0AAQ3MV20_VIGMU
MPSSIFQILADPSVEVEARNSESKLKSISRTDLCASGSSKITPILGHSIILRCPSNPPAANLDPSTLKLMHFWGPITCRGVSSLANNFMFVSRPYSSNNLQAIEK